MGSEALPEVLRREVIHWQGTDDSTPDGCLLAATVVLGIPTTYIIRDGAVIGRLESAEGGFNGYAGGGLKGGSFAGFGDFGRLAQTIANQHAVED